MTIGGGDEEHEIGARHELLGERLVLTDDRVRAWRVDHGDVVEKLGRVGPFDHTGGQHRFGHAVAVTQQIDDRRGRGHPFRHDGATGQRVDECRFAGIELADDHEQKERSELPGRILKRALIFIGGGIGFEDRRQPRQETHLEFEQLLLARAQDGAPAAIGAPSPEPISHHRHVRSFSGARHVRPRHSLPGA